MKCMETSIAVSFKGAAAVNMACSSAPSKVVDSVLGRGSVRGVGVPGRGVGVPGRGG